LVLAAIWAGFVATRTLNSIDGQVAEMKSQTAVAQASAEAALLNIKALIISERPGLLVSIEVHPEDSRMYVVRATNKGNTPAELLEGHCSVGSEPVGFVPPDDIQDPFFAPIQNLTVNGEGFEIRRFAPTSIGNQSDMERLVVVYGKLLYWDTFTDRRKPGTTPYVTQWCFTYEPNRIMFYRTANAYTKNT
jgi:hypothetical protein